MCVAVGVMIIGLAVPKVVAFPVSNQLVVPEQLIDVKVKLSPAQTSEFELVILGEAGGVTMVIVVDALAGLTQPEVVFVQVAE